MIGAEVKSTRTALAAALLFLAGVAADAPARADDAAIAEGQRIYTQICQGCHMPQAQGAEGAGHYPALARDPALASWQYMALTVLKGRRNMPAFSPKHAAAFFFSPATLTNEQVAAVINYVRTHFGNRYSDAVTAAGVAALDP